MSVRPPFARPFWSILLLALTLVAPTAARAQILIARITSATMAGGSTFAPGDTVAVNFTLAPGTAKVSSIYFQFRTADKKYSRSLRTAVGVDGRATALVTPDWPNGDYQFLAAGVFDEDGRFWNYPGGNLGYYPGILAAPGVDADFSKLGFTIAGGATTVPAPRVTAVQRTSPDQLVAGQPITVDLAIALGNSPLASLQVTLRAPDGTRIDYRLDDPSKRTLTVPTDATWLNGTYQISSIFLFDTDLNATVNRGTLSTAILPPTTDFQLSGGVNTVVPPRLTGITRIGSGPVSPGQKIELVPAIVAGTSPVTNVRLIYYDPLTLALREEATQWANGTWSTTPTSRWMSGSYYLRQVYITTADGRLVIYERDGYFWFPGAATITRTNHALNFTDFAFQVVGAYRIAPYIATQPVGATVQPNNTLELSVRPGDFPAFVSVQWYVGQPGDTSMPVANATSTFFRPPPASSTTTYWARIQTVDGFIDSAAATIAIAYPSSGPAIIVRPASTYLSNAVNNLSLSVFAVGPPPLSYQWFKNGVALNGETGASYRLDGAHNSDTGVYQVLVRNPNGSVLSPVAEVQIVDPPRIVTQPKAQDVAVGSTLVLGVTATGGNLTYRWIKDGSSYSNEATVTVPNFDVSSAGDYYVEVSNNAGRVVSDTVRVNVTGMAPRVVVPTEYHAEVGRSFGGPQIAVYYYPATFSATGLPPGITLQAKEGYFSGVPTSAGLFTARVTVTDISGSTTKDVVFNVHPGPFTPVITRQPVGGSVALNQRNVELSVEAWGTWLDAFGLRYQWYRNGQPVSEGDRRTISLVSAEDDGSYYVVVRGAAGTVTSDTVRLNVDATKSAPFLRSYPVNRTLKAGESFSFTPDVGGTAPMTYAWSTPKGKVPGVTGPTITVNNLTEADGGFYAATVTNAYGSVYTSECRLTVLGPPTAFLTNPNQIVAAGRTTTIGVGVTNSSPVTYQWFQGVSGDTSQPLSGATINGYFTTPPLSATTRFWVRVTDANGFSVSSATATVTVDSTTPASSSLTASAAAGGSAVLTLEQYYPGSTLLQWLRNGSAVSGSTQAGLSTSLLVEQIQPASTGVYDAALTLHGFTLHERKILGLESRAKVIGAGSEVGPNIVHANGNVYDQVLLQGAAASVTADPTQVLRISYVDLSNDIVQVELSGAGTLSLVLDAASGPVPAVNYNQPSVPYMKGHAGIVVTGADESTHLSVFSVGRITAVNQALFKDDVTYDGVADLAFVAIASANGKFGGLRTANASYFAAKGIAGVYAPNVQFTGPVIVGDINGVDAGTAMLVIGSGEDVRVAGGDLAQDNGRAVQVAGFSRLRFTGGSTSHGVFLPARAIRGRLERDGDDLTTAVAGPPEP